MRICKCGYDITLHITCGGPSVINGSYCEAFEDRLTFEELYAENERLNGSNKELQEILFAERSNHAELVINHRELFDKNARLQKAVDEAISIFEISYMFHGATRRIDEWKNEYGGKE